MLTSKGILFSVIQGEKNLFTSIMRNLHGEIVNENLRLRVVRHQRSGVCTQVPHAVHVDGGGDKKNLRVVKSWR